MTEPYIVACMITKDEETFIRHSVGAIYPYVDELVIVDALSTDKTVQYLKELDTDNKITIIEREWTNNYSDARNTYLKYIEDNIYGKHENIWHLRMDSDEVYFDSKIKRIKDIIKENPEANAFRYGFYTFVGGYDKLSSETPIENMVCLFKYSPDIRYINTRDEMPVNIVTRQPIYSHSRDMDPRLKIKKIDEIWWCHFSWTEMNRCFEKFNKDSPRVGRRVMAEEEKHDWWQREFVEREGIPFTHEYPEIFKTLGPIINKETPKAGNYVKNILLVNTVKKQCGVHQYGLHLLDLLNESENYKVDYCEATTLKEIKDLHAKNSYYAILYNYHELTTTKIFSPYDKKALSCKNICIFHDMYQIKIDQLGSFYDKFIIGDPTVKDKEKITGYGRILFNRDIKDNNNEILNVGSFGFNKGDKNFYKIVELVQREFDNAIININIPPNNAVREESVDEIRNSEQVRKIFSSIKKPGIKVNITNDFMSIDETIEFLAKNDINIFPFEYLDDRGYGISSSIDLALSAKRPIAISKCTMFRHILDFNLPITIEDYPLKTILENNTKVLSDVYNKWERKNVLEEIEKILNDTGIIK